MYFIFVASFPGLLPASHAMLCVRISSSALNALLTVEGEGTASMRARARRTIDIVAIISMVALPRKPHEATPLLPRLLGTPWLKYWLRPCVTSRPFQVVDLPPAPHQPPHRSFLFGKFNTQNHSSKIFWSQKNIFYNH